MLFGADATAATCNSIGAALVPRQDNYGPQGDIHVQDAAAEKGHAHLVPDTSHVVVAQDNPQHGPECADDGHNASREIAPYQAVVLLLDLGQIVQGLHKEHNVAHADGVVGANHDNGQDRRHLGKARHNDGGGRRLAHERTLHPDAAAGRERHNQGGCEQEHLFKPVHNRQGSHKPTLDKEKQVRDEFAQRVREADKVDCRFTDVERAGKRRHGADRAKSHSRQGGKNFQRSEVPTEVGHDSRQQDVVCRGESSHANANRRHPANDLRDV